MINERGGESGGNERWYIVAFIALALLAWLLLSLQAMLMPFFLAALLGYLGDPIVDRLEAKGLSRTAGVTVVFVMIGVAVVIGAMVLIPMLIKQMGYLHSKIPLILMWLTETALPWVELKLGMAGLEVDRSILSRETIAHQLKEGAANVDWGATGDFIKPLIAKVSQSGLALFAFLGNMALVPVVAFYLLRDWDIMVGKLRGLLPRNSEPTVVKLTRECDDVLGAFLKGQMLVMCALGTIYTLGLWMVGLKLALLIGMLAGLASIVPYLGFFLGITAALVASFFQFHDWLHPVMVIAVFVVGQAMEGMVLTPILVGDRIGLHPVAVIFSVLAGAQLFGFIGMLLALPVAAIIVVLLRHVHDLYLASHLYDDIPEQASDSEEVDIESCEKAATDKE